MKPVLLEMTAFGSYAKKTEISFDRLTHGLYLITGDTGAGKTTIFDAIVFALYGVASGTDRKPEMMHCDFVDQSVDTEVALRFRQGGREYKVTRTIHFPKKRGAEGQFGGAVLDAELIEPDREPTAGVQKVNRRCEELLGLNAEQFRKIVMLAQGKFKEFLDADGDKKNDILGKLFDNSDCLRYQELLKGARDALEKERGAHVRLVEETMRSFFLPPEGAEDLSPYLPEHPALAGNLRALAEADAERLEELEKKRDLLLGQKGELAERKGAAAGCNQLLDELAGERKRLAALESQAQDMARLQADCDAAEKALHQVQPKRELLRGAERTLVKTREDIAGLEGFLELQEAVVEAARTAVAGDDGAREELEALVVEIRKLEEVLPAYQELDRKRAEQQAAGSAIEETVRKKNAAGAEKRQCEEELKSIETELESLAGVDAEVIQLENAYAQARKNSGALTGKDGLQSRLRAAERGGERLEGELETLRRLTEAAADAEQDHHGLYQAFISGQAGLIAQDLRRELAERGSAVCPVCRSRFCAGQEEAFAALSEETPTQEAVDAAKREAGERENERRRQEGEVSALTASLESERTNLLRDAQQLMPECLDWETLSAEGYLPAQAAALRREEEQARTAWEEAVRRQERGKKMARRQKERVARLAELADAISGLEQELTDQRLAAERLDAEISNLQRQLQHPDRRTAGAQLQRLADRQRVLSDRIASHQRELDEACSIRNTTQGNLDGKRGSLPELERARADAAAALEAALERSGFPSEEAADRALLPLEGGGEGWLKERRGRLEAYRAGLEGVRNRIEALSEQTRGISYTDLAALQEQIGQADGAYREAYAACIRQEKLLENHRGAAERVSAAREALAGTEQVWKRLDLLAGLAVGVNGDGGRLSFDRYVMGAVFREILEMANQRLNILSGGRYELIHQLSADRGNGKAGLEVDVLDMATGKQRNSRTLSGGESFLASLALALGLSDVVQNHAGGKRLDALFIDEGFGSLDGSSLDMALDVLNQLTEGNCLVGIISHVGRLEESIPQKLRVKNGEQGSFLRFE